MNFAKLALVADQQAETIVGGCWTGEDDFDLTDTAYFSDALMPELFFSADRFEQRITSTNQNRISQVYVSRVSINI